MLLSPNAFEGRVVAITGGHTGIGFGIARAFVRCGAKGVALLGRRKAVLDSACLQLDELRGGPCAIGLVCDVRKYDSVEACMTAIWERWGRLDVVVNSAAGNFLCALEDLSPNAFKTVVDIDLIGTFNVSKAAYPRLRDTGRLQRVAAPGSSSSIINISATLHYSATRYQGHPAAAKAGVDALTRSMAGEWGPEIRVNGVAPGPVAATEGLSRLSGGLEELIGETLPAKRAGTVDDVAASVLFLASDAAAWITGHTLVVDGGAWVSTCATVPPAIYEQIRDERRRARL